MDFVNSSDGIINGGLSNAWSMTLGSSNTLKFVNFDAGALLTLKLVQDSSGSRTCAFPSSVLWQSGGAPTLQTSANAVDVFTFVYDGTNWRDTGGSASRLPSRIMAAGLGLIVGVGIASGGALFTSKLSGGTGSPTEIGKVADNRQVIVGTGGNATMTIREMGSGGYLLTASGGNVSGLGVGVPNLKITSKITDANLYIDAEGELTGSSSTVRGTMSGSKLNISGKVGSNLTATVRKIPCYKNNGDIGVMTVTATGGIATGACS